MEGAQYRANCLPEPREPFKRDTVDLDTILMIFHLRPKK